MEGDYAARVGQRCLMASRDMRVTVDIDIYLGCWRASPRCKNGPIESGQIQWASLVELVSGLGEALVREHMLADNDGRNQDILRRNLHG